MPPGFCRGHAPVRRVQESGFSAPPTSRLPGGSSPGTDPLRSSPPAGSAPRSHWRTSAVGSSLQQILRARLVLRQARRVGPNLGARFLG